MTPSRRLIDQAKRIPVVRTVAVEALTTIRAPLQTDLSVLDQRLRAIEQHLPLLLNVIASSSASLRELRREMNALADAVRRLDDYQTVPLEETFATLQRGLEAHIATQEWLVGRVETVRAEMLHELRYGRADEATNPPPRVVSCDKVDRARASHGVRLNLGAGALLRDGYLNVDVRDLPGIDIVASVDDLPFGPGEVAEISSEHLLEHFPEEQLRRQLLPYWRTLLQSGGHLRAVVPDADAMLAAHARGEIPFAQLRGVTFGGQEYGGDFHFTMFTPDSLAGLLRAAGFRDVTTVERARPNGECLEFEIVATRPGDDA